MFLTVANLAKSKAKIILVRMLSEAGTGVAFNMKRGRLEEKLVKLRYDPVGKLEGLDKEEYFHLAPEEVMMAPVKQRVLFREQKKIRSL